MPWLILLVAGLLEVVWALLLKQSEGLSKPLPTIGFLITLAGSMFLLSQALKTLPIGTAYAVWTGVGAIGSALVGTLWLGESRDLIKIVSLMLLVGGIAGLRLSSAAH